MDDDSKAYEGLMREYFGELACPLWHRATRLARGIVPPCSSALVFPGFFLDFIHELLRPELLDIHVGNQFGGDAFHIKKDVGIGKFEG